MKLIFYLFHCMNFKFELFHFFIQLIFYFFYIKFIIIGISTTVIIPDIPIDSPLIAPSTSPSSIAFEVPSACAEVPKAIPLATG